METKKSFCRICQSLCALDVTVDDGRVVAVRGDTSDPMSRGYSCTKGRQLPAQLSDPNRLRHSLRRSADGQVPVAIGDALDEIGEHLGRIRDEHGPRAIAMYCGTQAFFNAATMPVSKAWMAALGSPMLHTSLTIDQPAKIVAVARHGVWGGGVHTLATSDVAMLIGTNTIVSGLHVPGGVPGFDPVTSVRAARARGLFLIVVDPRRTELATHADLHLQVRPGEDASLLAGILNVILGEGLYDADFCAQHTEGLADLRAGVADFTPEYAARRAGVAVDDLIAAARAFGSAGRGGVSSGTGADMGPHPNLVEHLIATLNSTCGRFNREGDPVDSPMVLFPAVPRTAQAIPPQLLPPDLQITDQHASRIRGLRGVFGEMPTAALADEILTPGEGQVRALVVVAGNPITAWPDQAKTLAALDDLDLLVCLDIAPTATTRRADWVLACAHPFEREDVAIYQNRFYERPYAQHTPIVVERDGEQVEEWQVLAGLAARMDLGLDLPAGALAVEDTELSTFDVLELAIPSPRVPLGDVAACDGGALFDEIDVRVEAPLAGLEARLRLAPDGIVDELAALRAEPSPASGSGPDSFGHLLICRRLGHVMNSVGHDFPRTRDRETTNPACIHPDDLAAIGVCDGDLIRITSSHGSIAAVARAADDVRPGVVSMAHAYGGDPDSPKDVREVGTSTGRLLATDDNADPITGIPRMTAVPVRISAQ